MSFDTTQCEKLVGRLKDICRGEAQGVSAYQVYQYRKQWGFRVDPVTPDKVQTSISAVVKPVSQSPVKYVDYTMTKYPGANLSKLLRKYGVTVETGCGGCDRWINDMNQWGPQGCRERISEIEKRLEIKAKELEVEKGKAYIAKLGFNMIIRAQWPSIRSIIKKAIKEAEKRQ